MFEIKDFKKIFFLILKTNNHMLTKSLSYLKTSEISSQ